MTAGCRLRRFHLFRAAAVLVASLTTCWAQAQPVTAMPHVRSDDALIARLLAEAPTLSETFRRLVSEIETTNGLVYVEAGKCQFGVRACLIYRIDVAGPSRILRIVVNTNRDRDGVMGAIGHELQHAWEVLRVPGVTTTQAMFFNAVALAPTATFPIRFETDEAIQAGHLATSSSHDRPRCAGCRHDRRGARGRCAAWAGPAAGRSRLSRCRPLSG